MIPLDPRDAGGSFRRALGGVRGKEEAAWGGRRPSGLGIWTSLWGPRQVSYATLDPCLSLCVRDILTGQEGRGHSGLWVGVQQTLPSNRPLCPVLASGHR